MNEFEAYINIGAPFNLREPDAAPELKAARREAMQPLHNTYFARTADRRLKRSMCLYPTPALAEEAGMSLEEYANFVFKACKLDHPDPRAAWLDVRSRQQKIVDHLNGCTTFRYVNERSDITFTTNGRTWINSDGQTNMPSGEVYTSPEEHSVNGPYSLRLPGHPQRRGGEGGDPGGPRRRNTDLEGRPRAGHPRRNLRNCGYAALRGGGHRHQLRHRSLYQHILFDEKIGGTVHLAVGQSYAQAGGKNESAVHWDMIANMRDGGQVFADGALIYKNGKFIGGLAF